MKKVALIFLFILVLTTTVSANEAEVSVLSGTIGVDTIISLSVKNAPVIDVLDMLAEKGSINIVVSKKVVGRVTLNLNNITLLSALEAVLDITGLAMELSGNIVMIKPKKMSDEFAADSTIEKVFNLNYTDVNDIVELLKEKLDKKGKVTPILSSKKIVVEAPFDTMEEIEKLIEIVDVRPQQVLIEAKILEIRLDDSMKHGVNWKRLFTQKSFTSGNGTGSIETSGFAEGTVGTGLFLNLMSKNVEVFFDTLREEGKLNTLATPKVIAVDNKESKIIIGGKLGYRVTTTVDGVTTNSVEFLDVGTQLKLTPHIDSNENILLSIHPEISDGVVVQGLPSITTTEVDINVLSKSGEAIFIGGLIKEKSEETFRRVPVISKIPLLGYLFQRRTNSLVRSETVVLLTPYLLKSSDFALEEKEKVKKATEKFNSSIKKISSKPL